METIKKELKAHYKPFLILFIITTLWGLLVETPATPIQMLACVLLSVLIALIGGNLNNIEAFFNNVAVICNKIREQHLKDFKH